VVAAATSALNFLMENILGVGWGVAKSVTRGNNDRDVYSLDAN
jgi:hypothetical protein